MKTFQAKNNNRQIGINIIDEWIVFTYPKENNREFYSIPKKDWISDRTERLDRDDNWHTHMKEKSWFSDAMYKYIDNNTF